MSKINSLLSDRLKAATQKLTTKMNSLAGLTSDGQLSSFSGVFRVSPLTHLEQSTLEALLENYKNEAQEIGTDLSALSNITSEVKAINNQAAILHGERIKKAQEILKKYRDGAFSAWLIATYGNRQTPYNFLQYYELFLQLPKTLHENLDRMPRQAVYTLASRSAPLEQKTEIIQNYRGEKKREILKIIRKAFPLPTDDRRGSDTAALAIASLQKTLELVKEKRFSPSSSQQEALLGLVRAIERQIEANE
ncbi:MAG: CT583 family protein [Verrucomicrobia bacterium]|nr:CT583 family protein [Verrucomicrobiota bacterium]